MADGMEDLRQTQGPTHRADHGRSGGFAAVPLPAYSSAGIAAAAAAFLAQTGLPSSQDNIRAAAARLHQLQYLEQARRAQAEGAHSHGTLEEDCHAPPPVTYPYRKPIPRSTYEWRMYHAPDCADAGNPAAVHEDRRASASHSVPAANGPPAKRQRGEHDAQQPAATAVAGERQGGSLVLHPLQLRAPQEQPAARRLPFVAAPQAQHNGAAAPARTALVLTPLKDAPKGPYPSGGDAPAALLLRPIRQAPAAHQPAPAPAPPGEQVRPEVPELEMAQRHQRALAQLEQLLRSAPHHQLHVPPPPKPPLQEAPQPPVQPPLQQQQQSVPLSRQPPTQQHHQQQLRRDPQGSAGAVRLPGQAAQGPVPKQEPIDDAYAGAVGGRSLLPEAPLRRAAGAHAAHLATAAANGAAGKSHLAAVDKAASRDPAQLGADPTEAIPRQRPAQAQPGPPPQRSRPAADEAVTADADALLLAVGPLLRRAPAYAVISITALLGIAACTAARRGVTLSRALMRQVQLVLDAKAEALANDGRGVAATAVAGAACDNKLLVLLDMGHGGDGNGLRDQQQHCHRRQQPGADRWFVLHWWPDAADSGLGSRVGGRLEPLRAFVERLAPAPAGADPAGLAEMEAAVLELLGVLPPPSLEGMAGLAELQDALAAGRLREVQLMTLGQWCDSTAPDARIEQHGPSYQRHAAEPAASRPQPGWRGTASDLGAAGAALLLLADVAAHVAHDLDAPYAVGPAGAAPYGRAAAPVQAPGWQAGHPQAAGPGWGQQPTRGYGAEPARMQAERAFGSHPTGPVAAPSELLPRASAAQLAELADCIREAEPGQEHEPVYVRLGGLIPLRPGSTTPASQGPSGPDTLVGVMVCPAGAAHASGQVGRPRRGLMLLSPGEEQEPGQERGPRGRREKGGGEGGEGEGKVNGGEESVKHEEEADDGGEGLVRAEDPRDAVDRYLLPAAFKSRSWPEAFEVAMVERDGARVWVPYKRWRQDEVAGLTDRKLLRVQLPGA